MVVNLLRNSNPNTRLKGKKDNGIQRNYKNDKTAPSSPRNTQNINAGTYAEVASKSSRKTKTTPHRGINRPRDQILKAAINPHKNIIIKITRNGQLFITAEEDAEEVVDE